MKTELKNCLSLYKIFYSCAFILILCAIHPIIYYEEIGSAIQSPIAFLTIIFCSDTYLMEVKSKRADVFHLYDQKKQLKVISQRVGVQILYLLILSCVGYALFFWQKPGSVNEGISGIQIFLLYFIAMFGTIWLWSICSVILCTLLRNMWAGIGCLFGIVIGLISKAGSSFFGNLGLFSFSFCEPTQLMSESWIYGTLVSFIAGLFLFAVLPMTLKKRGCLVYMGGLSGVARNDLEQRITYYLEKTSLTEHQNKKMRQLSGGMKRRVGLIQALLNNPDFLIIDEPTTGLDPEERIRIRNLLVDFSKDRTVLFSTHVVEDLAATCTQLAIMKKGSFLYSGSVSGLLENAKGCVWSCTVQNAEEARLLENNYSISSKQYVKNGIHMKVLSKEKPNENCVPDNDITLEDAYIYLTNS